MGFADVDHLRAREVRDSFGCGGGAFASERNGKPFRCPFGLAFLASFLLALSARAHTPDTSYCRIEIGPSAVSFTFTFDLTTLARMAPIDVDRDERITRAELRAAAPAIEGFLRRSVFIELNEREATFGPASVPGWAEDRGEAIGAADYGQQLATLVFRNDVLHAPDAVALTFDFFGTLGERHTVLGNFAWKGAENPVIFTRFEPDYLFDTGYRVPAFDQFKQYLWLGMTHIFLGYDHVAFLLALLFVKKFRDLVKIVTAFSVAHTLTLVLAALGVLALPSRIVETAIAASIVYVAAENIWRDAGSTHRWRLTFAFGLVHGFGFATVLRELGLPAEGLVRSLLAFNLGVELGQLAIAAACWPALLWVSKRPWADRARIGCSAALLTFGAAWLLDRAFALGVMPI